MDGKIKHMVAASHQIPARNALDKIGLILQKGKNLLPETGFSHLQHQKNHEHYQRQRVSKYKFFTISHPSLAGIVFLWHDLTVPTGVSPLFRTKAIAAFATIACVSFAQQGSAGNAEFMAARPTLMVLPLAAVAPVALIASATADVAVFDYDSPARQIIFPEMEEQISNGAYTLRIPVPVAKPNRATVRTNREFRPAKPRVVAQVVRAKAESRRLTTVASIRFTGPMQPIIGAFR